MRAHAPKHTRTHIQVFVCAAHPHFKNTRNSVNSSASACVCVCEKPRHPMSTTPSEHINDATCPAPLHSTPRASTENAAVSIGRKCAVSSSNHTIHARARSVAARALLSRPVQPPQHTRTPPPDKHTHTSDARFSARTSRRCRERERHEVSAHDGSSRQINHLIIIHVLPPSETVK